MIVLEHTNPSTIYLDYHSALGNGSLDNCSGGSYTGLWYNQHAPLASGCFVNGYYYLNDYHVFLSSPLTKNKSTFSDYHWFGTSPQFGYSGMIGCGGYSCYGRSASSIGIFYEDIPDTRGDTNAYYGSRLSLFSH